MQSARPRNTPMRAMTQAVMVACMSFVAAIPTAIAQSNSTQTVTRYEIPRGTLDQVLNRFAAKANVLLAIDAKLTAGKTSSGLVGTFSVQEGLTTILSDSELEAIPQPTGGYALRIKNTQAVSGVEATVLPAISVQSARPSDLPIAYEGGQVARGGRLGMLGNTDILDAPFNITSYTAELIENQQARTIADVLANDPSVRNAMSSGASSEGLFIRGFPVGDGAIAYNGLISMAPRARSSVEAIERVEVVKGPSALLNGMLPDGSIGGAVLLTPKRAEDKPLTRLGFDYSSNSTVGTHVDIGRRFGEDNSFGVRVNGVVRNGEGPVDNQDKKLGLASIGLDYRGRNLRVAVDAYSQRDRHDGGDYGIFFTGTPGPVPDSTKRTTIGSRVDAKDNMVMARVEYDITQDVTAFGAVGRHEYRSLRTDVTPAGVQANGNYNGRLSSGHNNFDMDSVEAGIRAKFKTGSVQHRVSAIATSYREVAHYAANAGLIAANNIYNPVPFIVPVAPSIVPQTIDMKLNSFAFADTLVFWEERLLLTLGLRRQQVEVDSVWAGRPYDKSATTPMAGVVFKPWSNVSVYGNYIEGLSQGPSAPIGTGLANAGEMFPPFTSEQYEIGAKADWHGFGSSVSLFQISRPSSLIENNRFNVDGEQLNRGIEWNVYGAPSRNFRLLGGIVLMDAKVTKAVGSTQGKDAYGVPSKQVSLGAEWDTPFMNGITFSTRMLYTDSVYINSANTASIPSWTRWDAGARYSTSINGKRVTFRANIDNLFGEDYWIGHRWDGGVGRSAPRTVTLGAIIDF